jgi:hypothetical protein
MPPNGKNTKRRHAIADWRGPGPRKCGNYSYATFDGLWPALDCDDDVLTVKQLRARGEAGVPRG